MQLIEVNTPKLAREFLQVQPALYINDPNYIRPLDKDIESVFDPEKNKAFRFGEAIRWILKDDMGKSIGRIAAFVHKKYKNKGDMQPTGCFGFFDCIHHQEAANLLLDAAKNWLQAKGMQAMDGPVNFGERNNWWGVLVEGFSPPLYCMNYNASYYQALLENYGCQLFYYQNCYGRQIAPPLSKKFYDVHGHFANQPAFSARHIRKSNLHKYADDFCTVYNAAWAGHEGNKEMSQAQARKLFETMKPVMDEKLIWFAYHHQEPVAMYISLPDLNQAFKHLKGRFDLLAKLKFLYYQKSGAIRKFTGIVFGIVPAFQGTGVDSFMVVEAEKVIKAYNRYDETELQWMGDFNPKMNNICRNLDFEITRRLATYRYLFDRQQPFKRHPML